MRLRADAVDAHVAAQFSTRKPPRSVQRLYYSAIQLAKRRLLIQSPYFVPDAEAGKAFAHDGSSGRSSRAHTERACHGSPSASASASMCGASFSRASRSSPET